LSEVSIGLSVTLDSKEVLLPSTYAPEIFVRLLFVSWATPFLQAVTIVAPLRTGADALTMMLQVSLPLFPTYKGPLTITEISIAGLGRR